MHITNFMTRSFYNFYSRLKNKAVHNIKYLSIILAAGASLFLVSCEERPTIIGTNLLSPSDFVDIKSTDTISVRVSTAFNDSIPSQNPDLSYLGQTWDPYFGTVDAGLVTQMRLSAPWTYYDVTIDSVKLILKFLSATGNPDVPHYLRFSEIAEQIYVDSTYYSNRNVPLTPDWQYDIRLPTLKTDSVNDVILDIPSAFGQHIIRDTTMLFHDTTATEADFRSYFKGLYFQVVSPGDPMMVSMSVAPPGALESYSNYLILYFHDAEGEPGQFTFVFDAVSRNAAYNTYRHDFSTADPLKRIQHINDGYRDTVTFLQTHNGVFAKLSIPGLDDIKKDTAEFKGISVNKARLILPVFYDGDLYKASTLPSLLSLSYEVPDGTKYYVPDMIDASGSYTSFYDGSPDTTANVYNINIAAYIQAYLNDTENEITPDLELFLSPSQTNNVILKANNSHTPIKFEFTYTKF